MNKSSAGSASLGGADSSVIQFGDTSTANSAIIDSAGVILFSGSSKAGSASITGFRTSDSSSLIDFSHSSTAGSATIFNNEGATQFFDSSTAGSATINSSGEIDFFGSSKGGTARVDLFSDTFPLERSGSLDISAHNAPGVTIGSIEGDGNVFLGANNLTARSNNLSTTFSGVIQDGGLSGSVGGSLTKIGTGTFDLTGANTYTGNTNVNGGVLKVDGSITSNTFVNHGGTLAGTGTVNGNVTNNKGGEVSPGNALGTLTVNGNYTQTSNGTLLIDVAGTSASQFSVLDVLGSANLNGILHPVLLNGFIPTVGESFTFMDYASLTGAFSRIRDQVFDNGIERWVVTYQATEAVLTATANIPDEGSTLLLLTLSLLGLMTLRRKRIGASC